MEEEATAHEMEPISSTTTFSEGVRQRFRRMVERAKSIYRLGDERGFSAWKASLAKAKQEIYNL